MTRLPMFSGPAHHQTLIGLPPSSSEHKRLNFISKVNNCLGQYLQIMQIAPTTFNIHFRVEFLSICIINIKQDVSCSSEDRGLHA